MFEIIVTVSHGLKWACAVFHMLLNLCNKVTYRMAECRHAASETGQVKISRIDLGGLMSVVHATSRTVRVQLTTS